MEFQALAQPDIVRQILDYLEYPDVLRYCSINPHIRLLCQNDAYWRDRLTREFNIPAYPSDNQDTFAKIYRCTHDPDMYISECIDDALKKNDMRLLNYFVDYADVFLFEGDIAEPGMKIAELVGLSGRSDLVDYLIDLEETLINPILKGAGRGGHRALIDRLLLDPSVDAAQTVEGAAEGGHHDLLFDLLGQNPYYATAAISGLARGGHLDLLLELEKWLVGRYNLFGQSLWDFVLTPATQAGQRELIGKLLDRSLIQPNVVAIVAIDVGNVEILSDILERGANPDNIFDNLVAISHSRDMNPDVVRLMAQRTLDFGVGDLASRIDTAIKQNDWVIVEELVRYALKRLMAGYNDRIDFSRLSDVLTSVGHDELLQEIDAVFM